MSDTPKERAERALRHAPFLGLGKEATLPFVEAEIEQATRAERERCASRALAIVNAILEDLTDRRGLRHEWNQIEPEIQIEIMIAWKDATVAAIGEAAAE